MATEADKVNTGALATIAAVLGLSVLGIALAVTALVRSEEDALVDNRSMGARRPYDDLRAEQQGALSGGAVPIETAMANVVKGLQADPNSATPPSPADAAAPEPAASDAGAEDPDAEVESADGAAPEGESDAGAEPTEEPAPAPAAEAGAPKPKKPKPAGGATPPAPPPAPPTLPTPTGP
jgi:hypothetical protein